MLSSPSCPSLLKDLRVLFLDPVPESAMEIFTNANFKVDKCYTRLSESELIKRVGDYQVICIDHRDGEKEEYLTEEVLRSAHRLLAIGCLSRNTSAIDLKTAQQMGIPVFHAPYQHQHAVAELIISFIILLARQTGDRSIELHQGNWQKVSDGCHEIRGKTLGIIGYGHVGSQLGVLAEGIGMRVVFYDTLALMPIGRNEPMESLDDLLGCADFVAVCVSPIPENENMMGKAQFEKMKKGAYFINTSYGKAVDLDALAEAIKSKHLSGAALDSFPTHPTKTNAPFTHPFASLPNVILTPSIGESTAETVDRQNHEVCSSIIRFFQDGSTMGSVNLPSIVAWPLNKDSRRIVNIHRNVRGVLKEIDYILSAYNVGKQLLETKDGYGYLIADVNTQEVTTEIVSQLALLANTVRTRIL